MMVLVVGDVEPSEVFSQVEENIDSKGQVPEIKRIFPEEPERIRFEYVEQKLAVSMPLFQMGFKDTIFNTKGIECLKREIAVKILLDMIMGRSSELYNRLYNEGLINNSFDFDYSIEESYAYSAFGGESADPFAVRDRVVEEIRNIKSKGLDQNSYERIRRAMSGRFIKQLNSIERISHMFISVYFKDVNMFDYFNVYENMSFDYVKKVFDEHFNFDNLALSVINPA